MKFITDPNNYLLDPEKIKNTAGQLEPYIQFLREVSESQSFDSPESFINLPTKALPTPEVVKAGEVDEKLKYILLVGIGGSALGAKAIYDAEYGYFDAVTKDRYPKIIFLDTVDPEFLSTFNNSFPAMIKNREEVLVIVVSKSGKTLETIFDQEVVRETLPNIDERTVVITTEMSPLWQWAVEKNIERAPIETHISGRFSVFSSVGIVPLSVLDYDIGALRDGAKKMGQNCLESSPEKNPALHSAVITYLHQQAGIEINTTFLFRSELESLGKWYRQLMAESIGKERNIQGEIVHEGITPTVAIGTSDLHSMAQLYLGGPVNRLTTFVTVRIDREDIELLGNGRKKGLSGKGAAEVANSIESGVENSFINKKLPFVKVELERINAHELGEFMQFKMFEILFLAKLLNVNPFTQPEVEEYKNLAKDILAE